MAGVPRWFEIVAPLAVGAAGTICFIRRDEVTIGITLGAALGVITYIAIKRWTRPDLIVLSMIGSCVAALIAVPFVAISIDARVELPSTLPTLPAQAPTISPMPPVRDGDRLNWTFKFVVSSGDTTGALAVWMLVLLLTITILSALYIFIIWTGGGAGGGGGATGGRTG